MASKGSEQKELPPWRDRITVHLTFPRSRSQERTRWNPWRASLPSLSLFPEKPKLWCCLFPVLLPQREDLLTNYITGAPWRQHHPRETLQKMGGGGEGMAGNTVSMHPPCSPCLGQDPSAEASSLQGSSFSSGCQLLVSSDFPFVLTAFKVV